MTQETPKATRRSARINGFKEPENGSPTPRPNRTRIQTTKTTKTATLKKPRGIGLRIADGNKVIGGCSSKLETHIDTNGEEVEDAVILRELYSQDSTRSGDILYSQAPPPDYLDTVDYDADSDSDDFGTAPSTPTPRTVFATDASENPFLTNSQVDLRHPTEEEVIMEPVGEVSLGLGPPNDETLVEDNSRSKHPCFFCPKHSLDKSSLKTHILNYHIKKGLKVFDQENPAFGQFQGYLEKYNAWSCEFCATICVKTKNDSKTCDKDCPKSSTFGVGNQRDVFIGNIRVNPDRIRIAPIHVLGDQPQIPVNKGVDIMERNLDVVDVNNPQDFFNKIAQAKIGTIGYIPNLLCVRVIKIYGKILKDVIDHPENLNLYLELFVFAKGVLFAVKFGNNIDTAKRKELQRKNIEEKLALWESGRVGKTKILQEVVSKSSPFTSNTASCTNDSNKEVAEATIISLVKKHISQNEISKAASLLTSSGIHKWSPEIQQKILELHPRYSVEDLDLSKKDSIRLTTDDVNNAIFNTNKNSAAGPDGFNVMYLRNFSQQTNYEAWEKFLSVFTDYLNLFVLGKTPNSIGPFFSGANITPLKKGDDGAGVRPIAVGNIPRRIIGKATAKVASRTSLGDFSGIQFGVGIACPTEAIIHALNFFVEKHKDNEGYVLCKVDFKNAFNEVSRKEMHRQVNEKTPSLKTFVEGIYVTSSPALFCGKEIIESQQGVQQGDPMAPVLFCMAIQPLLDEIKAKFPNLDINAWYLDDGNLVGSIEDISGVLKYIDEHGPRYGLKLNRKKTELWWPKLNDRLFDNNLFHEDIFINKSSGTKVLGGVVGDKDAFGANFEKEVLAFEKVLERASILNHSQYEFQLFKQSYSFPRICHILRTSPPDFIDSAIVNYNKVLHQHLNRIMGVPLSEFSFQQVHLPVKMGGFGLSNPFYRKKAAYIGSVIQSVHVQSEILKIDKQEILDQLQPTIDSFNSEFDLPNEKRINLQGLTNMKKTQKYLSEIVDKVVLDNLLSDSRFSVLDRYHLRALADFSVHSSDSADQNQVTGCWLNILPSSDLDQLMESNEFKISCQSRLGLDFLNQQVKCSKCMEMVDVKLHHLSSCDKSTRHHALQKVIFNFSRDAGLNPSWEVKCFDDSKHRPGDVYFPHFPAISDKKVAIDLTIISGHSNFKSSGVRQNTIKNLEDADAEKNKIREKCLKNGIDFFPFAMDTTGHFSKPASKLITAIANAYSGKKGVSFSTAKDLLKKKLLFTLAKFEARHSADFLRSLGFLGG